MEELLVFNLKIIGVLLFVLGVTHAWFPRYFQWKQDLAPLSLMNRQMMYGHTFFIALTVIAVGALSFFCPGELITTALGKKLALGLCVFWGLRGFFQLFFYSSELWKGKQFETMMHVLFTIFWFYMAAVFGLSYYLGA